MISNTKRKEEKGEKGMREERGVKLGA